ncbi:hypothetical protein DFJ74DRAFT_656083 [Hyaloraphidium curvatum]|nr:hypothetical protein DFJ74DRAFT_656083 [Hyaloraphidium curvatum]
MMQLSASKALLAVLALCAAAALLGAAPAAAQGVSPNSNNQISWVKGNTCVSGQSVGGDCCCPKRPRVVVSTKFTTKTAIKTVKRTRTVTRTVTTTTLNRRRMERDVVPEVEERSLPEPEVAEEEVAAPEVDVAERDVPEVPEVNAAEEVDEEYSEAPGHELFARNLCPACPNGVNPRLGANANNNGGNVRLCCPRSTRFTTRTKTTTRVKTTTVKTATKTVTRTATQSAAASVPVSVFSQTVRRLLDRQGNPVAGATVALQGPLPSTAELGRCTTDASGSCVIRLANPLPFPGSFALVIVAGAPAQGTTIFASNAAGQPDIPPGATSIPVTVTETNTFRLGRREMIGRRDADGKFRRALKALATPAPEAF